MATLEQIIAKREELAKTNPNATNIDARKALTATPTPATPAPTPATPIAPTVNVMDQMAGKTVEERQAIRSGMPATPPATTIPPATPAPIVNTPVDPTTGLSKPLETTPATTATTSTPATPDQTPFQQAQAESEKIKAQNEAQMKLNSQQAELKTQERQQIAQETAQANIPTNQKDVLNALVSGVSVAPQNTQAYRSAQAQYKNYQKFATMTPTQLVDNMKMGEIDTATAGLLASNPNYIKAKQDYEKIQTTKSINNMVKATIGGMTGKTEEVDYYKNASDSIAKKLGINETNADAYARIVSQDPETLELTKTVSSVAKQLNTLNTQRNEAYAELKKKYPDMSASDLMTLMGSRTQDTTDQINALNSTLSLTQADLKMAMEMAQGEYEATQKDIAMQSQLAGESRQMKNQLALSQAQFDQKVAQQAQTMGTPELAIPSVIEQYASQGIFAQKSAQQHIADAKALIAKGVTLGEYISQMQKDYQAKPEYKAKFAPKATENYTLQQLGDKTYKFNQATGDYEVVSPITAGTGGDLRSLAGQFPGQAWAKNNNPAGITWNANFDKGTGTAKLLADAGIQFSKGTARPASEGGNYVTFPTIEDGLKAQQIMMTQTYGNSTVGNMLSSWVGTSEGPNYAKQVAGMAGITDLNQKVSALSPEQVSALQMAKIKKESPGLYGLLSKGTGTQNEDIQMQALSLVQGLGGTADERKAFADNVIKVAQRDNISLPDAKKKLGYKSADDTEFAKTRSAEYKTIKSDTRDKLSNASTALTLLNQPQTAIGDVASIVGFLKTIDPASVARESEVDSVRNARGVIDTLSNQFAQLKEGTKLTDTQRNQLKDSIQTIVNAGNAKYYEYINDTEKEFRDRGLDPTVYISKTEIDKAKGGTTNTKTNPITLTKEAVTDIYNNWKSNRK